MPSILNLSKTIVRRLYEKYLEGKLQNSEIFVSAGNKRSQKNDFSFEKNILASELALNPSTSLKFLSEKFLNYIPESFYSLSTVSRIIKSMNYTRKTLKIIPIIVTAMKTSRKYQSIVLKSQNNSDDNPSFLWMKRVKISTLIKLLDTTPGIQNAT
ncbi:hypothetical protein DMUE_5663 [Dictyocoela muelleri]|nr:hypothetical protein DMUE_5663 [Dictyocoela muelleri]